MGECIIERRVGGGGRRKVLPILNANYPTNQEVTYIDGNTASATFKVEIVEDGYPADYSYQWYVDGKAVSGGTEASYTWKGTEGKYNVRCDVISKAGTVQSRTATLNVVRYYKPVLNSSYPANVTTMRKNTITTLKVSVATAGNPASYTYQWYKDGKAISGATSSTYAFSLAEEDGTYKFYCKVTNAAGSVQSRTATVTLKAPYLYDSGDQCTSETGGWQITKALEPGASAYSLGDITFYDTSMLMILDGSKDGFLGTKKKIDLTHYSKIRFYISYVYTDDTDYQWHPVATSINTTEGARNGCVARVWKTVESGESYTIDVDISGVTGAYYVGLMSWMYDGYSYAYLNTVKLLL